MNQDVTSISSNETSTLRKLGVDEINDTSRNLSTIMNRIIPRNKILSTILLIVLLYNNRGKQSTILPAVS